MPSNGHIRQDTDVISEPGTCPNTHGTCHEVLVLKRTIDIHGHPGIIDDADIRSDPDIVFKDDLVKCADDSPLVDSGVLSYEQKTFFRIFVPWMEIDVRIPFDSNTVRDVDISGTVYHDARLDVDILPVRSESKPVLEVDEGIPEPFFFHVRAFL